MSAIRSMEVCNTNGSFALRPSNYVDAKALSAASAESFTVPTGDNGKKATYVLFCGTGDFYASYTGTASVPGDTSDGTASELNPTLRFLNSGVTTISVIAPADCVITASWYM